jgi:putative transposase
MPQSLSCLLVHLVFSTKERHPFLAQNELMLRTHAYLGGILREASCPSLTIGGTADHVHAFFHLSRTQHVAKIVETLKSHSSRWIKAQGIEKFAWQRGYGCFSVGQSQVQALLRYIQIKRITISRSLIRTNFASSCVATKYVSTSDTCGIERRARRHATALSALTAA